MNELGETDFLSDFLSVFVLFSFLLTVCVISCPSYFMGVFVLLLRLNNHLSGVD